MRVGRTLRHPAELGRAAGGGGRSGDRSRSGARVRHRRARDDAPGDRDGRGDRRPRRSARFLDLGCGSGILSIAAARLWPAARGLALDVDPESVATTDENLALNRITSVATRVGSLDVGAGNDLVLANIEAGVLVPLAPDFPSRIGAGRHADPLRPARRARRRRDRAPSRRRLRRSRRAATRTSGRRCACRCGRHVMSRRRLFVPPERLRATPHHRRPATSTVTSRACCGRGRATR